MSTRTKTSLSSRLKAANLIKRDLHRYGLVIFAISGLINVLALTGSIYMMQVYDRVLSSGSQETLIALSVLALALLMFHGSFDAVRSSIFVKLGARLDKRLSPMAHRVAIEMPRYGFSTAESLEKGRSIDTMRGFLSSGAPAAIFDLPWMPIFLIFVYLLHPVLGTITLCGAIFLATLTIISEVRTRSMTSEAQQAMVRRNITAESNANNADAITAMGVGERAIARYIEANDEHLRLQTRSAAVNSTIVAYSRMFRMVLQSALLGIGAYFAIQGQMSPGAIIAVSIAASRALAPIDQVIGNWRNILGARHAYNQLHETIIQAETEADRFTALPTPKSSIRVENLTVASPATGRILLSDVSFELQAGQAMAVVGPSGGGKSSLMRALAGVWSPLRGAVRLDDVSLSHYDPTARGSFMGYLPQEVSLFSGSIVENISRFSRSADSEAVCKAANETGIHKLISDLPDGYNTQVGTNGTALSAGQRQRVGLARALYGDPFLVLLDEPNAALDAVGERALNDTIMAIRERGGIVIVVAHRSSVLKAVDTVAVIHGGKLVSVGPTESVIANKGGQIVTAVEVASARPSVAEVAS